MQHKEMAISMAQDYGSVPVWAPDLVMFSLPNHLTLGDQQKEIPDVGGFAAPDAHLPCRVEKLRFRQKPCHPEEVLTPIVCF